MKHTIFAFVAALFIGFPSGWILSMALTPLLWRLETVLHVEMAGHSGPSDWVFYVVWALLIPSLFVTFRTRLTRNLKTPGS